MSKSRSKQAELTGRIAITKSSGVSALLLCERRYSISLGVNDEWKAGSCSACSTSATEAS